jgi:hypothetical protein
LKSSTNGGAMREHAGYQTVARRQRDIARATALIDRSG